MVLLTQEHFVSTIDAIRMQLHKDCTYADAVCSLFNTDSIGPYDNSLLIKQLISLLQMYFPRDKEGFCDIEHYCFELNFGKCGDQELVTAEDLYHRLIQKWIEKRIDDGVERQLMFETDRFKYDPSVFVHQIIQCKTTIENKEEETYRGTIFNANKSSIDTLGNKCLVSTHPLIDDYPFKKDIDGKKEH